VECSELSGVQSLRIIAVRSWQLRPRTVREHNGRGTSAVEAATKQRLGKTEKTMCAVVTVIFEKICRSYL
jgi:hypothetical protein